MCLSVKYRRPNYRTDHDQIWHAYMRIYTWGWFLLKTIDPPPKGGRSANFRGVKKSKVREMSRTAEKIDTKEEREGGERGSRAKPGNQLVHYIYVFQIINISRTAMPILTATRWAIVTDSPIAKGPEPFRSALFESVVANTVNTSTNVIMPSMTTPHAGVTSGLSMLTASVPRTFAGVIAFNVAAPTIAPTHCANT